MPYWPRSRVDTRASPQRSTTMPNTRVQLAAAVAQAEQNAPMRAWAPFPQPVRGRPNRRPAGRRVVAQRARRTASRSASRGDPDLADPDPPPTPQPAADVEPPRDSDLNVVWREALHRFETAAEFEVLGGL